MWTCEHCQEEHEDQFSACWNCEGNAQPRDAQEEAQVRFRCAKCQGRDSITREHRLENGSLVLGGQSRYLAVTCQACAYTEFYDLELLDES